MIKIIVVDDHALFRLGLVAILKEDSRFDVVGEYKSLDALKPAIPTLGADLALVDIELDAESGFDVAKYIREESPRTKVIMLSFHKEQFYVVSALEAGVDGYIHKDSEPEELIRGIGKVLKGEKFYSSEISNLLVCNFYKKNYRGLPFLTHKEKEVVNYLMKGYSSKEIATELNVSPRTVETHRANILGKFSLKNTTELVTRIAEQRIKF